MAQDQRTANFIKDIYHDIVPVDYRCYYLLDTAYTCALQEFVFQQNTLQYILEIDSNFSGKRNEDYVQTDSISTWDLYNLDKAITIPNNFADSMFANERIVGGVDPKTYKEHIDSFKTAASWNEIYAPLKRKWSKKRRMKIVDVYSDSLELSIPKERNKCFNFSKPIFTKDYKYAIVELGNRDSNVVYIYKHEPIGWRQLCGLFVWY
jgi:hypothetical protein